MHKIFTLVVLLALSACSPASDEVANPLRDKLRGTDLASLAYQAMSGEETTLKSLHNGKPVLVNYWATWCVPCVLELPSLQRLEDQGKFQIITVSFDNDPTLVEKFLKDKNLPHLTVLFDRGGAVTGQKLGISGVPTTLILDQQLVLQGVEEGGREWDHAATIAKIYEDLRQPAQPKGTN
jgi:thiol-disulfide isomerase/thioredoxin